MGGAYEAIGSIMQTLKNHWFFICFEHLELLGRALEIILERWGVPGSSLRGPWGSLEGPWGDLGAPMCESVVKTKVF